MPSKPYLRGNVVKCFQFSEYIKIYHRSTPSWVKIYQKKLGVLLYTVNDSQCLFVITCIFIYCGTREAQNLFCNAYDYKFDVVIQTKIIEIIIIHFQILFIATKGSSYRSDIALDDITFKNQSCISTTSSK